MTTTTPPPVTPPKSPPPAPKKCSSLKKKSPPATPTRVSEFIEPTRNDRFTTGEVPVPGASSSQNTPAKKKKKRIGWQGKTKGYNYKLSKQGKSNGTGLAKHATAAPRRAHKHVEMPDLSARELTAGRSTRSKGGQEFHALSYNK